MLPVSHCFRVSAPFMSGCTSVYDESRFFRRTAVWRNFRATAKAALDGGAGTSGFATCAGWFEIGELNALPVPRRTKTEMNAIAPATKTAALIHSRRRCARGEETMPEKKPPAWGVVGVIPG